MKKVLLALFTFICLSAFAQQENHFYTRITIADTNEVYNIYFERYTSTLAKAPSYGKSISVKHLQKLNFDENNVSTADDIYFDAERKWCSFGNNDSMLGSPVVTIKSNKTIKEMLVVVPIQTLAKHTEIHLQDLKFKAGKYIDILTYAVRFDEDDNTLKITTNKKTKNKATTTSSFKLPKDANISTIK